MLFEQETCENFEALNLDKVLLNSQDELIHKQKKVVESGEISDVIRGLRTLDINEYMAEMREQANQTKEKDRRDL